MASTPLPNLDAWDADSDLLNVIIETPKGSRNKLKYEPTQGLFELNKVLPRGMAFPYDFGFIPSTMGDDGDPLDVVVLMDEPVPAGCKLLCLLIGVIEAEQTDGGKTERNDRLLVVAEKSHDHEGIRSVKDLNENLVDEIEHFFIAYHEMDGKKFKPLGRHGPNRANKLVQEGVKRRRQQSKRKASAESNGRPKTKKGT